jgi:hypothetical protein
VDPGLLARWEADPSQAPGRHTSSPWPDHIQITQVTQQAASYLVQGAEILKTSADTGNSYSGFVPIIAQVVKENGQWRVAAYQEIATSSASTTTAGFN